MSFKGEVSYKVKKVIGFLPRFTVAQLVDATGLSYEQVEGVVQKLRSGGFVSVVEEPEMYEPEKEYVRSVGRPRNIYALTDDAVKRSEFFSALEAIESAVRLGRASERRPSTVYYEAALEIIQALETGEEDLDEARIEEATSLLEYGRQYEELIAEGAEVAQAYYDLALARLHAYRRRDDAAMELVREAARVFETAGLEAPVREAREVIVCTKVRREFARARDASDAIQSAAALKNALVLLDGELTAQTPFTGLLAEALHLVLAYLPSRTVEDIALETSRAIMRDMKQLAQLDVATARLERQLEGQHLADRSALGRGTRRVND